MSKAPTPEELEMMSIDELREKAPARLNSIQASAILGVSRQTFWRWRQDGLIPGVFGVPGRRVIVLRDRLLDWMEQGANLDVA